MGKKYPVPLWGIILLLLGGIGSTTLMAFRSDSGKLQNDIDGNTERIIVIENKCAEFVSEDFVIGKIKDHEAVAKERYIRIDENINEIKTTQKEQNELLLELLKKL